MSSAQENLSSKSIESQTAPEPVGPYPHARLEGEFLFLSGMGPRKKGSPKIPGVELDEAGEVLSYDIEKQTHSVFENLKTVLNDSGASLEEVIDVQVFLTNMKDDFKKFNRIYAEYFQTNRPTRTTIGISALPTPIHVELKVIARIPKNPA